MREIKFRAWSIPQNKFIGTEMIYFKTDGTPNIRKDTILMQFTGFKDINGKDIYEKDIIIIDGSQYNYTVNFVNGEWRIGGDGLYKYLDNSFGLKIVGNLYEYQHQAN